MARLVKLFLLLCLSLFDNQVATPSTPSFFFPPLHQNHLLCSQSEKTALLQFMSLFGENTELIDWKDEASGDCCSWYGVTCDELTGHVTSLYLRDRKLHGAIPSNSTLFHLSHLEWLDLSENDFIGSIISPAFGLSFPNLTVLYLSSSNFTGPIHNWLTSLTELYMLDLSNNKFTGPIPTNISSLQKLTTMRFQNNLLSGTVPPDLFDIPMLVELDLGFNRLSGAIPTTKWLQNSNLISVWLNDNQLQGSLPESIVRLPSLSDLRLSNNNLSGTLAPQLFLNSQQLYHLDLSHNSFQGPLPQLPPSAMGYFSISHNKLEGDIPLSYCDLSHLVSLVLSHNNLSGIIPDCITNSSPDLAVLDLGMNNFHGTIPDNFSEGNGIVTINLKGNRLGGKLPHSLAKCSDLTVLDIGNNTIKDTFPYWLQSLPKLQVLVLRHNKFHGSLGGLTARTMGTVTPFPKLRILDLSHNEFIGPLPSDYFHRLRAMRNTDRTQMPLPYMINLDGYNDTIEITLKGVDSELPRILEIFAAIDLSDNNFEGEIPKDIGSLRGIQSLNLSHNALVGTIQSSLENLTSLESLDLSSNQLSGVIPQELTRLYFLQMLKLSSNLLTGQIPRGFQFNTFDKDSYGGNLGLCGPPLSKKCSNENGTPSPGEQEEDDEDFFHAFTWKTVLLGYGCGTALGLGVGFVIFKTGRPKRLVTFVEDELLYMTTKRPRPAIVFLSEAQRRRRLRNPLS